MIPVKPTQGAQPKAEFLVGMNSAMSTLIMHMLDRDTTTIPQGAGFQRHRSSVIHQGKHEQYIVGKEWETFFEWQTDLAH